MNYTLWAHLFYAGVGVLLTAWVARVVWRHGNQFLLAGHGGDEKLARAVNRFVVMGFLLFNLGVVAFALSYGDRPADLLAAIESLSTRISFVFLMLSGTLTAVLFLLWGSATEPTEPSPRSRTEAPRTASRTET